MLFVPSTVESLPCKFNDNAECCSAGSTDASSIPMLPCLKHTCVICTQRSTDTLSQKHSVQAVPDLPTSLLIQQSKKGIEFNENFEFDGLMASR